MNRFRIFCTNISNPSLARAKKQFKILKEAKYDVLVLTETKDSSGCNYLIDEFNSSNYYTIFDKPSGNEYGVLIVSKHKITKSFFYSEGNYLHPRVQGVNVLFGSISCELIGVYVPSNDRKKILRKKRFIDELVGNLNAKKVSNRILCGDFNSLEPNHFPKYGMFRKWEYDFYNKILFSGLIDAYRKLYPNKNEYSWVGRTGNGYRYDHFFISKNIEFNLVDTFYCNNLKKNNLTDHLSMVLEMEVR